MATATKLVSKSDKPAGPAPRRSLLDLAPLELACMNTLWPLGEGTVREIRDSLAARRPRAYTTIMTIMDRLARKGVVERRKSGRAYVYKPNLSVEEARRHALAQVIDNFFGGSNEIAATYLAGPHADRNGNVPLDATLDAAAAVPSTPVRVLAATAAAGAAVSAPAEIAPQELSKDLSPAEAHRAPDPAVAPDVAPAVTPPSSSDSPDEELPARIDETLL